MQFYFLYWLLLMLAVSELSVGPVKGYVEEVIRLVGCITRQNWHMTKCGSLILAYG